MYASPHPERSKNLNISSALFPGYTHGIKENGAQRMSTVIFRGASIGNGLHNPKTEIFMIEAVKARGGGGSRRNLEVGTVGSRRINAVQTLEAEFERVLPFFGMRVHHLSECVKPTSTATAHVIFRLEETSTHKTLRRAVNKLRL